MLTYRELAILTENMTDEQKDKPVSFYTGCDMPDNGLFPSDSKSEHPSYDWTTKLVLIKEYLTDEDDEYDKDQYAIVDYITHEAKLHLMRLGSLKDLKKYERIQKQLNRRIKETKIRLQKVEEELFGDEQSNLE